MPQVNEMHVFVLVFMPWRLLDAEVFVLGLSMREKVRACAIMY